MKLHLSGNEALQEAREQTRVSEASRISMMSELNDLMNTLQKEILKIQLRQEANQGNSELESSYVALCKKYRDALESFKKREEYLLSRVREVSNQKSETEEKFKRVKEELEDMVCELNYYKGVLEIETAKNQAERNTDLEQLLENSNKLLETQALVNKNCVEQLKVLQNRNLELSNRLQELENAKIRETNDECYRFSFGTPFSLEDYQDRMRDLIKEHLIQKGINCKVKLLSNGDYQVGKKSTTIKIETGELVCTDNGKTVIFGDFLDKHFKAKTEKLNKSMEYRKSPSKSSKHSEILAQKTGMRIKHVSKEFSPILSKH